MSDNGEVMHRDDQCASDVGKMMMLRRFEQEFIAYGTIHWKKDRKPSYLASMHAGKLFRFMAEQEKLGNYCIPTTAYIKRTLVPSGMEDAIAQATKYVLLGKMKNDFSETGIISLLDSFFRIPSNDEAYDLLLREQERIDGYYDDRQLQIFEGLVMIALRGKILTAAHFDLFMNWIGTIRREMEDNPIPGDAYKRTFFGFVQEVNGRRNVIVDAKEDAVLQRWEASLCDGNIVGPMIHRVYYFSKFTMIKDLRKQFGDWIMEDANEYFDLIYKMRALPGVIDEKQLLLVADTVKGNYAAERAVNYYMNIWNKKIGVEVYDGNI